MLLKTLCISLEGMDASLAFDDHNSMAFPLELSFKYPHDNRFFEFGI
jgi:hypothetical protein